jgi:spore coat polysaccharide biosynthesis predicted glycosyltransferase SpsG
MKASASSVVFRVAGGPRLGFGHIVRALSLSKAMQVSPRMSVRGTAETKKVAHRLGATVKEQSLAGVLARGDVRLLVIDDPDARAAADALALARRHGAMVASIHDLGLAPIASDLAIDGSLAMLRKDWPATDALLGPRYAVLDPSLLTFGPAAVEGQAMRAQSEGRLRVLVSLGGGPRVTVALRIARAIADASPYTWVTLAAGFSARALATKHPRVRLLESPSWLRSELARVDVAVVAGGVTLYEAALLGVPTVALAVVAAQMPTIRAFDRVGASIAAGCLAASDGAAAEKTLAKAVQAAGALLADEDKRRAMAAQGQQQVDGRGALRVAAALKKLMEQGTAVGWAAEESATPQGAERDLMLQAGSGAASAGEAEESRERKPVG